MSNETALNLTEEMNNTHSSTQEFYDRRMLRMTEGIENMGGFSWELLGALCVAWTLVYFAIWKSVKVTGKVVYFTGEFSVSQLNKMFKCSPQPPSPSSSSSSSPSEV